MKTCGNTAGFIAGVMELRKSVHQLDWYPAMWWLTPAISTDYLSE